MDTVHSRGIDPVLVGRFPAFSRHSNRWANYGSLPRNLISPSVDYAPNYYIQPVSSSTYVDRNNDGRPSRDSRRNMAYMSRNTSEIPISRSTLETHISRERPEAVPMRSNTLPRTTGYGSVTDSRFVENTTGNYSDARRRNRSPERYHNNTVYNNHDYTGGGSSSRRHRRNRSLSPRRPQNNSRNFTRRDELSTTPGYPTYSGRSHEHTDPVSPSVHYYTYSDDDKDYGDTRTMTTGTTFNDDKTSVSVKEVDFMVHENSRAHHTDKFSESRDGSLIIRRGQKFLISIVLNQKISLTQHNLVFLFITGANPQPGKGTYVCLSSGAKQAEGWSIQVDKVFHDKVTFAIQPPPTTIIGEWKVLVGINMDNKDELLSPKPAGTIIILFNPWERDDDVFFPEEAKLSEYILNDSGGVFSGSEDQIGIKPWFYGQFEPDVLKAALFCVDRAFNFRTGRAKGDPVRVARVISKIVNSNDDNGVLMGNWSSDYGNETPPLSWIGSVKILRKFLKTSKPVKYGQCFVFAGVVTTICRALGIPCRTVTNFSSAHDTDGSVTVDVHWDPSRDKPITEINTDTIWNFHVWNDVWMKRRDLPVGNDGWQVLDATPQETSDGEFRCGPAPLSAILNGRCDVSYDAAFIYAEVNADRVNWSKSSNGSWNVIGIDKQIVGKMISTKVPDGKPIPGNITDCEKYREDITHEYKYHEGGDRERISMLTASSRSPSGPAHKYLTSNDIKFEIQVPNKVYIGSSFDVIVVCSNVTGLKQTITGRVLCDVTKYTGSVIKTLRDETFEQTIEAYEHEQIVLHVEPEDYVDHVTEAAMFKLSIMGKIPESSQQFASIRNFRLLLPDLIVKARGSFPRVGQPVTLDVSLTNPFTSRSLFNCLLQAECTGMKDDCSRTIWNILPGEDLHTTIDVTPGVRGVCPVYLTFHSENLHDLKGTCELFVQ